MQMVITSVTVGAIAEIAYAFDELALACKLAMVRVAKEVRLRSTVLNGISTLRFTHV